MKEKIKKNSFIIIFSFLGTLLLLFISIPILKILFSASSADLVKTMQDPEVIIPIFLTLRAALWATIAALITGIPLAYIIARKNFTGKKIVEAIIDLPIIIPHTAAGIALLMVWGRKSLLAKLFGLNIMGTEAAISIAMFFVSVSFLINAAKEGFRLIDYRLEKTAITLGASPAQAFFTVTFPLAKKSIFSGMILMWGRGISEFGAVVILAYHPMTAPVMIFDRFQNFGLKYAVPLTVILILISLIIFVIVRSFSKKCA